MSYSPELLAVGPYSADIAKYLEYAEGCYSSVPIGTPVFTSLFGYGSSHYARDLAKCCGVPDYTYQHKLQNDRVDQDRLKTLTLEWLSGDDRDHFGDFVALVEKSFEFFYIPEAFFNTYSSNYVGAFLAVGTAGRELIGWGRDSLNPLLPASPVATVPCWEFAQLDELKDFCSSLAIDPYNVATHLLSMNNFDPYLFNQLASGRPSRGDWHGYVDELRKLSETGFRTWLIAALPELRRQGLTGCIR